jgi:hypothetical protein
MATEPIDQFRQINRQSRDPLQTKEVFASKAEAEAYAAGLVSQTTTAYAGQTVSWPDGSAAVTGVIQPDGTIASFTEPDTIDQFRENPSNEELLTWKGKEVMFAEDWSDTIRTGLTSLVDYPTAQARIYVDIVNGDDGQTHPFTVDKPLKTLNGVQDFFRKHFFHRIGDNSAQPQVIFLPGDYAAEFFATNNIFNTSVFKDSGIETIMLKSKANFDAGASNITVYDDSVILPRIYSHNNELSLFMCIGLRLRSTTRFSLLSVSAPTMFSSVTFDLGTIGNSGFISSTEFFNLIGCRFTGGVASQPHIIQFFEGSTIYGLSILQSYNITEAVVKAKGNCIINTATRRLFEPLGEGIVVTGNKFSCPDGSDIKTLNPAETLEDLPGDRMDDTRKYGTSFSNAENLENAPIFKKDGAGTKFLSDDGTYIEAVSSISTTTTSIEIYVFPSYGNDSNNGLSIDTPLKSFTGLNKALEHYIPLSTETTSREIYFTVYLEATKFLPENGQYSFLSAGEFSRTVFFYSIYRKDNTSTSSPYNTILPSLQISGSKSQVYFDNITFEQTRSNGNLIIALDVDLIFRSCVLNATTGNPTSSLITLLNSSVEFAEASLNNFSARRQEINPNSIDNSIFSLVQATNSIVNFTSRVSWTVKTGTAIKNALFLFDKLTADFYVGRGYSTPVESLAKLVFEGYTGKIISYLENSVGKYSVPFNWLPGTLSGDEQHRYNTFFTDPENLENAPIFDKNGDGTKVLSNSGDYVDLQKSKRIIPPYTNGVSNSVSVYVDSVNGDDANDALSSQKACKTWIGLQQRLYDYDFCGGSVRIVCAAGNYDRVSLFNNIGGFSTIGLLRIEGAGVDVTIFDQFDCAFAENVLIAGGGFTIKPKAICMLIGDECQLSTNIKIDLSSLVLTNLPLISVASNGRLQFNQGGKISILSSGKQINSVISLVNNSNCSLTANSIELLDDLTVVDAFIKSSESSFENASGNSITTGAGVVVGKKFSVTGGASSIFDNANSLIPGTIEGTSDYGTNFSNPGTIEGFSTDVDGNLMWNGKKVQLAE